MKTTTQTNQHKQKRKPKTPHRITALLLALLLTATTLSPTITAQAERESGGHDTGSDGDNETSGGRPTGNDASFETNLHSISQSGLSKKDYLRSYSFYIKGEGHFNIRSLDIRNLINEAHVYYVYIFSDKPFTTEGSLVETYDGEVTIYENYVKSDDGTTQCLFGDNLYYYKVQSIGVVGKKDEFKSFTSPNKMTFTSSTGAYDTEDIQKYIESTLDLTKDDYKSDEDKANMTPVRDESIGYLPRARYFDDRVEHKATLTSDYYLSQTTSTIQWDSFVEPYTDIDNYYVEVYAKLHYTLAHKDEDNPDIWKEDASPSMHMYRFKKFGELKYVSERLVFSYNEPLDAYLQTLDVIQDASGNKVNPKSETNVSRYSCYVSDYYVRLVHYDYEKQQVLCGGFTRLKINNDGSSTSSQGDFSKDEPDDNDDWKPDEDEPEKDWDNTGDETDPSPPDPEEPDFGLDDTNVFTLLYTLIKALLNFIVQILTSFFETLKSLLSLVGDFPSLCKNVFSFLPDAIFNLLYLSFLSIILLRFLGR